MELKVKIPYKLAGDKSEVALLISVQMFPGCKLNLQELVAHEILTGDKGLRWSVQLDGEGVEYLNYWLRISGDRSFGYDKSVIQFRAYEDFMNFLKGVKEAVEIAWKNYNNESQHVRTMFEEVKELFEPLLWKEDEE